VNLKDVNIYFCIDKYLFVFNGMGRRNIFGFVLVWVSLLVLCARRVWRCCVCVLVTSFVEGRPILLGTAFLKRRFKSDAPLHGFFLSG